MSEEAIYGENVNLAGIEGDAIDPEEEGDELHQFEDAEQEGNEESEEQLNEELKEEEVEESEHVGDGDVAKEIVSEDNVGEDNVGEDNVGEDNVAEDNVAEDSVAEEKQANANAEDDDLSEIDEDQGEDHEDAGEEEEDEDEQILSMGRHKKSSGGSENTSKQGPVARRDQQPYHIDEEGINSAARRREDLEKKINAALKSGKGTRRKKVGEIDLEQMQDAQIQLLKNVMRDVAYEDARCISEKSGVATNKLKLLPKVKEVLLRKNLADSILDNNLLEGVRIWLEPLPDGSLPAYEIQKTMFDSISELPIKTIHLRESGLGKVMLFYQKSKRVEPGLRRVADKLVGNWTRPILNLSDNYHDKFIEQQNFDVANLVQARKRKREQEYEEKTLYELAAERRSRASIPAARTTAYKIAPKVSMNLRDASMSKLQAAGIPSIGRDDLYKKINSKLNNRGKSRGAKKSGVSIEGRDLY